MSFLVLWWSIGFMGGNFSPGKIIACCAVDVLVRCFIGQDVLQAGMLNGFMFTMRNNLARDTNDDFYSLHLFQVGTYRFDGSKSSTDG